MTCTIVVAIDAVYSGSYLIGLRGVGMQRILGGVPSREGNINHSALLCCLVGVLGVVWCGVGVNVGRNRCE